LTSAHETAEWAARDSYGRLVARLATRCRDLAAVEDALGDAFTQALEQWPRKGIPEAPEAWLLTVARRRLVDAKRSRSHRTRPLDESLMADPHPRTADSDDRLRLLFVCTHPAIDPVVQTPLMLQTVLGLDVEAIARAFVVCTSTMSQRLVRAKQRIRDLRIPFDDPPEDQFVDRLDAVLNAIYAAYGTAHDLPDDHEGLAAEALHLGRMLVDLKPDEPEVRGLLALMLHCEARHAARWDHQSRYVPLIEQDTTRWDRHLIAAAEAQLWTASTFRKPGRFQWEAAIQSAHNNRIHGHATPWPDIVRLYRELVARHDTVGARVAWAASLAAAGHRHDAIDVLRDADRFTEYQPYWALMMDLAESNDEADRAGEIASRLATNPRVREFIDRKRFHKDL
jgi:predicted RNA polymerase sigma factor